MDERYSEEEKIAIASVLFHLAGADFRSHDSEHQCFDECLRELGYDTVGFVPIARNVLQVKAYNILKRMTKAKKTVFSRMMTRLSRSDSHFGPREQAFVKEVLEMCEVPFVHR